MVGRASPLPDRSEATAAWLAWRGSVVGHLPAVAHDLLGPREGQRPRGHPPLEHVVGEASGSDRRVEVAQAPGLVEVAGEDRKAPKRGVRLFVERTVRNHVAVLDELRPERTVSRLE